MKKILSVSSVTLVLLFAAGAALAATELKSDQEKRSYAIGASVAKNIKQQGMSVDTALVARGMLDEMEGKSQLNDTELVAIMQKLQVEVRQKMIAEQQKAAEENKKKGEAFLADHKKQEGVQTLPSGLQYKILTAGSGKKPTETDTVECNYRGMLVDGKVFDASQPGKPATFKVAQVIPGWQEALKLMPVGSKWQLAIPANRAYGERGAGNVIGPNETLIFEVELIGIK